MTPGAPRPRGLAGAAGATLLLGVIGAFGTTGLFASSGGFGMTGARAPSAAASPQANAAVHGLGSLFPDGAPARVAGGFGGDTCLACHWEFDDKEDSVGSLQLTGIPDAWVPGESYPLEIEVRRPGMVVGGFQLAARFAADTTQAGSFRIPERESGRIALLEEAGLIFAQHAEAGIPVYEGAGRVRWSVVWMAPGPGTPDAGDVVLNVSALAGDGDRSQMGDYVYSAEFRIAR